MLILNIFGLFDYYTNVTYFFNSRHVDVNALETIVNYFKESYYIVFIFDHETDMQKYIKTLASLSIDFIFLYKRKQNLYIDVQMIERYLDLDTIESVIYLAPIDA